MTVDKLEQLAILSEKATQGEWQNLRGSRIEGVTENGIKRIGDAAFIAALVNWYRSGGAELVRDGLKYRKEQECRQGLEDYLFGTSVGSFEEFALKDLAVWDLIDEVEALRRGVGFTHVGPDPLLRLRDKWAGLIDREELLRNIQMVRESRERAARQAGGER